MGRLALVGGHSILGNEPDGGLERQVVETRRGAVTVLVGSSHLLLQRHGYDDYTTAAQIDHRANLEALQLLECDRILAIGSVGGLRTELGVGTFLCPDDFIAADIAFPPPCTTTGLIPTASMKTMSRSSPSTSSLSSIALPPTLIRIVFPRKACMYGSASTSTSALSICSSRISGMVIIARIIGKTEDTGGGAPIPVR